MVDTGADTAINYLWEDDDGYAGTPTDATNKVFGSNLTLPNPEGSNRLEAVTRPGSREPVDYVEGLFEGSWSVEFNMTNPWWLRSLFGEPSQTDNGDGTFTYDYTGNEGDSMQIRVSYPNSNDVRVLKGCVVRQASMSVSPQQDPRVQLRGAHSAEEIDTGAESQVTTSERQLTFAESAVDVDGSTKMLVERANLDIPTQAEIINSIGNRTGVAYVVRTLEPTMDLTEYKDAGSTDSLQDLYGGTTSVQDTVENEVTATLAMDNGESPGSGKNSVQFDATGTLVDSVTEQAVGDPAQALQERIRRVITGITASATNETATAP